MDADEERKAAGGTSAATRNTLLAGTGCGCLMSPLVVVVMGVVVLIFGGLGVLLAPLIFLILLFGGGGGSASQSDAEEVVTVFQGDGGGELDETTVPDDLVDPINEAGSVCDVVGPVVIAAQIERESGFNASMKGPDGELGLSQLPPAVFEEYGEDDDDNDETSALDAEDSIMAQGRYLCALADQVQKAVDDGTVTGSVLDLALAAYHVGPDVVLAAGGLPQTNEAQGYVAAVRAQFANYSGVAPIPYEDNPNTGASASPAP
ncbi:hypothetical protein SHKM778_83320 [Streptomyces sp. KM77-8]|uniref:Transglycosylase SLT domain-containing protein n=1 Tax=Streptomyces haneummycinicus TaxID=3074435 RepID=A0AAT9HX78_9ACTN